MDYVSRLMRRYRELVTNPAWRAGQERREAEKLEWLVRRLMEWDGVSEVLPSYLTSPARAISSHPLATYFSRGSSTSDTRLKPSCNVSLPQETKKMTWITVLNHETRVNCLESWL